MIEERNLGEQAIATVMEELGLAAADLVKASPHQLTYKLISRACKGRRLNLRSQQKVCEALNLASNKNFSIRDLFSY